MKSGINFDTNPDFWNAVTVDRFPHIIHIRNYIYVTVDTQKTTKFCQCLQLLLTKLRSLWVSVLSQSVPWRRYTQAFKWGFFPNHIGWPQDFSKNMQNLTNYAWKQTHHAKWTTFYVCFVWFSYWMTNNTPNVAKVTSGDDNDSNYMETVLRQSNDDN